MKAATAIVTTTEIAVQIYALLNADLLLAGSFGQLN
jgi:hypothetical protein